MPSDEDSKTATPELDGTPSSPATIAKTITDTKTTTSSTEPSIRVRRNTAIHRPDWIPNTTADTVDQAAERKSPPTLLTLPADIRQMIYDLTCYHHENGGYIAPAIPPCYHEWRRETWTRTVVDGEHCTLYVTPDPWKRNDDVQVTLLRRIEGRQVRHSTIAHICRLSCLQPPAITRVNCQLRQEALSYFYGVNKFVFGWGAEYGPCGHKIGKGNCHRSIMEKCVSWWQKNQHLQQLEHLELVRYGHEPAFGTFSDDVQDVQDRIIVSRAASAKYPTVELDWEATDFLCPVLGHDGRAADSRTKLKKRKDWLNVRGQCIAELYKHLIQYRGLDYRSLEMLLLSRQWFRPRVAELVGISDDIYSGIMCTFMYDVRTGEDRTAGKGKKWRMIASGEVGLQLEAGLHECHEANDWVSVRAHLDHDEAQGLILREEGWESDCSAIRVEKLKKCYCRESSRPSGWRCDWVSESIRDQM